MASGEFGVQPGAAAVVSMITLYPMIAFEFRRYHEYIRTWGASTCLVKPDLSTPRPDDQSMFTLPSFTEQFPLPPPFSTRQGASRPGIDSIASHTRQGSPSFSLGREGWLARVAGALYEGRQREEGPELRSCGVLLLSLWGTSPNIASLSEVRHVGLTGTWGLFDKAAACGLDHGFSQPCATLHSNVHMSCHV